MVAFSKLSLALPIVAIGLYLLIISTLKMAKDPQVLTD